MNDKSEQHRPISQKIFIILAKVMEAMSDGELNAKLDKVVTERIQTFKKINLLGQPSTQEKETHEVSNSTASATSTIVKMVLFNLDKLLLTIQECQQMGDSDLQMIAIDEEQLEMLVKLLIQNEANGEMVNKIYEIFLHLVEVSSVSSVMSENVKILDNSKSLL